MADTGDEVEVCRSYRNTGRCRFGDDCKFEHSEGEPIAQPERRERGECFNFRDNGECAHADRCRFSHGPDDTRGNDRSQEVCRNFLRGRCANGDECPRKHEGTPVEPKARAPRQRKPRAKGVCFSFRDNGECERGDECQFTHGEAQGEGGRRPRRERKPKAAGVCFAFRDNGDCERGQECRFVHGEVAEGEVSERKPRKPRTVVKLDEICNNFKAGKCRLGDRCRRIHEEATE